jgi:hypothetical protein
MDVIVNGKKISLSSNNTLGVGGEATVFVHGKKAFKIFHQANPEKAKKLKVMIDKISPSLPDFVIAPSEMILDAKGNQVVGFTMSVLRSEFEVIASLSKRNHRAATGIGTRAVAKLFLDAHQTLSTIHKTGAVVGDLNDLNELYASINGELKMAWIDVDSFQIPGFPCDVATETFLDPHIYGPDPTKPVFTKDGKPRIFQSENDWYSFAVMLFRSLTLVHPYGGVEHTLPTIPRRALAKKSVFSKGVNYPAKIGYAIELLSDDFTQLMLDFFERDKRVLPFDRLQTFLSGLIDCKSCGSQYPSERKKCPSCAALAPIAPVISIQTDCTAEDLLVVDGEILAVYSYGDTLRCLAKEGKTVSLYEVHGPDSRHRWDLQNASPSMEWSLSSNYVAMIDRESEKLKIYQYPTHHKVNSIEVTTTDRFGIDRAAFGVSQNNFYRLARGMIMKCAFTQGSVDERPLTQGAVDQTWISVFSGMTPKGDIVFGCYRIFSDHHYFMTVGQSRFDLERKTTALDGTLVDENVVFSDKAAVLLRSFQKSGVDYVSTIAMDLDGNVIANYTSTVNDRIAGSAIRGGVLVGKSLLFATDHGIAREKFGAPTDTIPSERKLFKATEPYVAEDAPMAQYKDGIAVGHGPRLRLLKMS